MAFRPEAAVPMCALADVLLRDPNTLTPGERELIASYVSRLNNCEYCYLDHSAVASHHLDGDEDLVESVCRDPESAAISDKLKALLAIAAKVTLGGSEVKEEDIERARGVDATDKEIHDAVMIAALFCMANRYVDGLATWAPSDKESYREDGQRLAEKGYVQVVESDNALAG
jgi:uncharacterized peroxidase-related enzyme